MVFEEYLEKSTQIASVDTLTPENILERLTHYYKNELKIQRLFYSDVSIENNAVELAIFEGSNQLKKLQKLSRVSQTDEDTSMECLDYKEYHELYTNLWGEQGVQRISYKRILDYCPDVSKKLLILGAAGIGKTTLTRRLLHEKALGSWGNDYTWAFYIPLGNLTESNYPKKEGFYYRFIDIFYKECLSPVLSSEEAAVVKDKLNAHLAKQESAGKLIWILDGYDEISPSIPQDIKTCLHNFLKKSNHVILTSRSYNLYDLLSSNSLFSPDAQLEITGFSFTEIKDYVRRVFSDKMDKAQGERLLTFISNNPSIAGICRIPINLELVCYASKENPSNDMFLSMSRLYYEVVVSLCIRYLKKNAKIESNQIPAEVALNKCIDELAFLDYFAFDTLNKGESFLALGRTNDYMRSDLTLADNDTLVRFQEQQKSLGIIKPNNQGGWQDARSKYYFAHLTFRDFFIARYLCSIIQTQVSSNKSEKISHFEHRWLEHDLTIRDYIIHHRYDAHFEVVWWFVAGLLAIQADKKSLLWFIEVILSKEKSDLITLSETQLLLRCFDETNAFIKNFPEKLKKQMFIPIKNWANILIGMQAEFNKVNGIRLHSFWENLKLSRWVFQKKEMEAFFISRINSEEDVTTKKLIRVLHLTKQYTPNIFGKLLELMLAKEGGPSLDLDIVDLNIFVAFLLEKLKNDQVKNEKLIISSINFLDFIINILKLHVDPFLIEFYLKQFDELLSVLLKKSFSDDLFMLLCHVKMEIALYRLNAKLPFSNEGLKEDDFLFVMDDQGSDSRRNGLIQASANALNKLITTFYSQKNGLIQLQSSEKIIALLWKRLAQQLEEKNFEVAVLRCSVEQMTNVFSLVCNPTLAQADMLRLLKIWFSITSFKSKLMDWLDGTYVAKREIAKDALVKLLCVNNRLGFFLENTADISRLFRLFIKSIEEENQGKNFSQILKQVEANNFDILGILLSLTLQDVFKCDPYNKEKSVKKLIQKKFLDVKKMINFLSVDSDLPEPPRMAVIAAWSRILFDTFTLFSTSKNSGKEYVYFFEQLEVVQIVDKLINCLEFDQSYKVKQLVIDCFKKILMIYSRLSNAHNETMSIFKLKEKILSNLVKQLYFFSNSTIFDLAVSTFLTMINNQNEANLLENFLHSFENLFPTLPSVRKKNKTQDKMLLKLDKINFVEKWLSIIIGLVVKTQSLRLLNQKKIQDFFSEIVKLINDDHLEVKLKALNSFYTVVKGKFFLFSNSLISTIVLEIEKLKKLKKTDPIVLITCALILYGLRQVEIPSEYFLFSFEDDRFSKAQLIFCIKEINVYQGDKKLLEKYSINYLHALLFANSIFQLVPAGTVLKAVLDDTEIHNRKINVLVLIDSLQSISLSELLNIFNEKLVPLCANKNSAINEKFLLIFGQIIVRRLIELGKSAYFIDDEFYFYEGKQYIAVEIRNKSVFLEKINESFKELTAVPLQEMIPAELYQVLGRCVSGASNTLESSKEIVDQYALLPSPYTSDQTPAIDHITSLKANTVNFNINPLPSRVILAEERQQPLEANVKKREKDKLPNSVVESFKQQNHSVSPATERPSPDYSRTTTDRVFQASALHALPSDTKEKINRLLGGEVPDPNLVTLLEAMKSPELESQRSALLGVVSQIATTDKVDLNLATALNAGMDDRTKNVNIRYQHTGTALVATGDIESPSLSDNASENSRVAVRQQFLVFLEQKLKVGYQFKLTRTTVTHFSIVCIASKGKPAAVQRSLETLQQHLECYLRAHQINQDAVKLYEPEDDELDYATLCIETTISKTANDIAELLRGVIQACLTTLHIPQAFFYSPANDEADSDEASVICQVQ